MSDEKTNGWNEWSHKVLEDLERIDKNVGELYAKINNIEIKLAVLETKAGTVGAIFGTIFGSIATVTLTLIMSFLKAGKP